MTPGDAEALDDPVLRRRARHVTTENDRVDALVGGPGRRARCATPAS